MKYFASEYEYENWEETWWTPIDDNWKCWGYDIVKIERMDTWE